jgi:DNA-binding GntR family transcriptional regulator
MKASAMFRDTLISSKKSGEALLASFDIRRNVCGISALVNSVSHEGITEFVAGFQRTRRVSLHAAPHTRSAPTEPASAFHFISATATLMDTSDQALLLPPLQPIAVPASLRDKAYAALKQMITEADIYAHPEEIRLDERHLSQALGVSRTPIREAMTLLEQEGFLRTEPRRGIFIVRKTKKQIIEMIEMWAALESMAARLATVNASDADIAGLRLMFDEFRNSTPAEHIEEYSDANIAFHQAIIRLSGSHLMGKTIDNLFINVRAIR